MNRYRLKPIGISEWAVQERFLFFWVNVDGGYIENIGSTVLTVHSIEEGEKEIHKLAARDERDAAASKAKRRYLAAAKPIVFSAEALEKERGE